MDKKQVKQSGDFLYTEVEDGIRVMGYVGNNQPVVVPEEIEGKPVTVIGARDREDVTLARGGIVVPKTVREIELEAMRFGTSLHWLYEIIISEDNPYLTKHNGMICTKDLKEIIYTNGFRKGSKLIIPAQTEIIRKFAFSPFGSLELKKFKIPSSVREIQEYAFGGCKFNEIDIPATVEYLGDHAFSASGWGSGFTVILHGNTRLGQFVADSIEIANGCSAYVEENGLLMSADKKRLIMYKGTGNDTELVIPDTVEYIDEQAFRRAYKATKVKFGKSLKRIGSGAFSNTNIRTARLPATVEYFAPNAFSQSRPKTKITFAKGNQVYRTDDIAIYRLLETGKEEIVKIVDTTISEYIVPDTVERFARGLFENCENLTKLILPEGFKEWNEFNAPKKLAAISIPASVEMIKLIGRQYGDYHPIKYTISEENERYFIDDDILYEVHGDDDYTLLFSQNTRCRQAEIIEGTTAIADRAFSSSYSGNWDYLSQVTIPSSVKRIGECSFVHTGLKRLVLPEGVEMIETSAFADCEKLEKVVIPSTVSNIATNAFRGCTSLCEFVIAEGNTHFRSENGVLINNDTSEIIFYPSCSPDKEYEVPDGIVSVTKAFSQKGNLQKIIIPTSVRKIGEYAFIANQTNIQTSSTPR